MYLFIRINICIIFNHFKPELFEVTLRGCYTCIIVFCLCEQCFVNIFLNVSRHYSYIKDNPPLNVNFYGVYTFEVIKIDILLGISLFLHIDIYMVYVCMEYSFIDASTFPNLSSDSNKIHKQCINLTGKFYFFSYDS